MVPGKGRLLLIGTPIGNFGDLSPRAREALAAADLIAAEDTREARRLLGPLGIERPLLSLHEHNELARQGAVLERLGAGATVAVVSDAGMPLISDPGFPLVRAALAAGFEVGAVPGPSAVTMALAVSGLPTDRFVFEGFLPAGAGERQARLAGLRNESRTLVFFETPHRIRASLQDLGDCLGMERAAAIARELTKTYETIYRGTVAQLIAAERSDENLARGEITLVVAGSPTDESRGGGEVAERVIRALAGLLPPARIATVAAKVSGLARHDCYARVLQLSSEKLVGD
ncbi:MAG: 16S rRNA (cytidine(1402)-2'-O)-methyltransferase [Steroidobacteraceae bacterium]